MLSFLCNGKTFSKAEVIGKYFLLFEVLFTLMKLQAINEGHAVSHYVTMKMLLVLMDSYNTLVIWEEFFGKLFSYFQNLYWSNLFITMEADDIVCIHPAIVFVPKFLLFKPGLIYLIWSYLIRSIWTYNLFIMLTKLFFLQDILEAVPHGTMAHGRVIDDLINSHIFSPSFLKSPICSSTSSSLFSVGSIP